MSKKILVVARDQQIEALRMAAGLTLLDDEVCVTLWGKLDESSSEAGEQLDALDFADVPIHRLCEQTGPDCGVLAQFISEADTVYIV